MEETTPGLPQKYSMNHQCLLVLGDVAWAAQLLRIMEEGPIKEGDGNPIIATWKFLKVFFQSKQ